MRELAQAKFIATADIGPLRSTANWFFAFALVLVISGLLIDAMEARRKPVPLTAVLLIILTLIVVVALMPATGAWLLFPPTIALVLRARRA